MPTSACVCVRALVVLSPSVDDPLLLFSVGVSVDVVREAMYTLYSRIQHSCPSDSEPVPRIMHAFICSQQAP